MQSLVVLISIGGAVALLLFALRLVQDGVTEAFGLRLKLALGHGMRTAPRAFLSGLIATLGLQSSTATALMTAGFVERDMIAQGRAQVVLLGANLGTALTALIVTAGLEALSPALLLIGYALQRQTSPALAGSGRALIGIGLVLLSLILLTAVTAPLRDSEALTAFLELLDDAPPVAFAVAAGLAVLFSSSLAVVMLVLAIGVGGGLDPAVAVVLVLGANFGGAIPPVLATLSSAPAARRVTVGNLTVRGLGCLVALPFVGIIGPELAELELRGGGLPVDAHLAFNLVLAALIWPFAGLIARGLRRALPDPSTGSDDRPHWLDEAALDQPDMALAGASREALVLGDTVERMLNLIMTAFRDNDPAPLAEVTRLENRVDQLQQEVKMYLARLGSGASKRDKRRTIAVLDYIINLEHAGDIIDKGLAVQVDRKITLGLRFSDDGYRELGSMFDMTLETMKIAQAIFMTPDQNLAKQLVETKVRIRHMERRSAERHFKRLRKGHSESLHTSSLHMDMLRDLKRITAHLVSVAHPILDEEGMLVESRLKDTADA